MMLLQHKNELPAVWVWVNSREVCVALSFPFIAPDWDTATLSGP